MRLAKRPSRRSWGASVVLWGKLLADAVGRTRVTGIAAEMAMWLFLSILPIAAVAGLVVARFAMKDPVTTSSLLAALPPGTRDLLSNELARVSAWNGGAVAPIAAATFVWLASSGVHSIFDGLELVAHADVRPWWKKRVLAIAACIGLSIGVAALAFLGTGLRVIEKIVGRLPLVETIPDVVGLVVRLAFAFAIAVGSVAGLYAIGIPSNVRKRMPLIPGAVAAVVAQGVLGFGYGTYVRHVGNGGAYQAGLAVIGVTMIGLYLLSIAILLGVALNSVLGARRLLEASVHPAIAPPPPVTDGMIGCEHEIDRPLPPPSLRPSWSGASRAVASRSRLARRAHRSDA